MRTDVKLGIGISMALVLLIGGYLTLTGTDTPSIPVLDNVGGDALADNKPASKEPPTAKRPDATKRNRPGASPAGTRRPGNRLAGSTPEDATPARPRPGSARPTPGSTTSPAREGVASSDRSGGPRSAGPRDLSPGRSEEPASDGSRSVGGTSPPGLTGLANRGGIPLRTDAPTSAASDSPENPASDRARPSESGRPATADRGSVAVEIHRAQPGDTLVSLAQAYYGSATLVPVLRDANPHVTDPSRIPSGTAIKIPPAPAKTAAIHPGQESGTTTTLNASGIAASGSGRTYTVKPGDSFYRIAEQQLGNASRWKELLKLNDNLVNGEPTRLQPGQIVVLPGS